MKTRRSFLAALAGLLPAAFVGRRVMATPAPGREITPEQWNREFGDCRLLLNGEDITTSCFLCNVAGGWADCYVLNAKGDVVGDGPVWMEHGRLNAAWTPLKHRRYGELRSVRTATHIAEVKLYGR